MREPMQIDWEVCERRSPEERLMVAVLGRAVRDLLGEYPKEAMSARQYLMSSDEAWVYSVERICWQLDWEVKLLREFVMKVTGSEEIMEFEKKKKGKKGKKKK